MTFSIAWPPPTKLVEDVMREKCYRGNITTTNPKKVSSTGKGVSSTNTFTYFLSLSHLPNGSCLFFTTSADTCKMPYLLNFPHSWLNAEMFLLLTDAAPL